MKVLEYENLRDLFCFVFLFIFPVIIIIVIPHIGFEGNGGKTGYLNDRYSFVWDLLVPLECVGQVMLVGLTCGLCTSWCDVQLDVGLEVKITYFVSVKRSLWCILILCWWKTKENHLLLPVILPTKHQQAPGRFRSSYLRTVESISV